MQQSAASDLPRISVVVPCYNVGAYLNRSLGSLARQNLINFEVIAVDDGSTDDTSEVLQAWARQDMRVRIHQQANQGPHAARLAGIRLARAEWVAFMDADDEMAPEHLQNLWERALPGVAVVISGIMAISLDGREEPYGPHFKKLSASEATIQLLIGHYSNGLYPCWNKLYRKSLLREDVLAFPRISYGEDQIFNLRVFRVAVDLPVVAHAIATYRYMAREGSLMRSISERHIDDFFVLWGERDAAAQELLVGDVARFEVYRRMRQIAVMDFFGNVYRSRHQALVQRFWMELQKRAWLMPLPLHNPILTLRWLKYCIRLMMGRKGLFLRALPIHISCGGKKAMSASK